jgi:molybdate transport system regulatory protein
MYMKPKAQVRFRVDFTERSSIGPGKVELLECLQKVGSVSRAARAMGMSYRRAWTLLETINKSFDVRATVHNVGGVGGGGVEVTAFGELLITTFREAEKQFNRVAKGCMKEVSCHARDFVSAAPTKVSIAEKPDRRPK